MDVLRMGLNKQLMVIGSVGVAVTIVAVASWSGRDSDGHLLVMQLFEIAGPPTVSEETEPAKDEPRRAPREMKPIGSVSDEPARGDDIEQTMSRAIPSVDRTPYVGRWVERSITDRSITTLTTTFGHGDSFTASANVRSRGDGETVRIETRGRWTIDGNELVMVVDETSAPDVIPVGFVQRCGASSVSGDDWSYEDADGRTRVAQRR